MQYKHIIWDYNGTLLNDASLCVEVINGMLSKRKLPLMTIEKYREMFDFPVKDYYEKTGFNFKKESFEIVGTEFIKIYDERLKTSSLHEGVNKILQDIHNSGIKQSVLSARKEEQLLDELKYFKIFNYFEEIIGLNDHYAGGKINIGLKLIEKINLKKEKVLMIGDTKHDAEVAKAMGINCILISHGHHTKKRLQTCGVEVFNNMEEINKWLSTNLPDNLC